MIVQAHELVEMNQVRWQPRRHMDPDAIDRGITVPLHSIPDYGATALNSAQGATYYHHKYTVQHIALMPAFGCLGCFRHRLLRKLLRRIYRRMAASS